MMSIRAILVFEDVELRARLWQQSEGSPGKVAKYLEQALRQSWRLPRFEADDFAAAYIAVTRRYAGHVRLLLGDQNPRCQYWYHVAFDFQTYELMVRVRDSDHEVSYGSLSSMVQQSELFEQF